MFQRVFIAVFAFGVAASPASAQGGSPAWRVEGHLGHAAFIDEEPIDHFVSGGAARYQLSPRVSIGPEVIHMVGPGDDRDLFLTGNAWFDLLGPSAGKPRRATPYLVAGAGLMRHQDEFFRDFTSTEFAVTGGFGVRVMINDRWYVAPEARLGWEPHTRLSASIGYVFGR